MNIYYSEVSRMLSGKLVVVGEYNNLVAADLAKTRLDSSGIPSVLKNESIAQVYPGAVLPLVGSNYWCGKKMRNKLWTFLRM